MPRACPTCQSAVSPRSRFCPTCGGALPASEETSVATALSNPSSAGGPQSISTPAPLPATASVSSVAAPSSSAPAPSVSSASPVSAPPVAASLSSAPVSTAPLPKEKSASPFAPRRTRAPFGPELCPIEVAVNFSRMLVAGHATTMELRVGNTEPQSLEHLEISLESRGFSDPATATWRRLVPGQPPAKIIEVEPARAGNFVLQVAATWESGGQRFAYRGQRAMRVLQAPESGNIQISIGDIQGNAGTGANQGLGADYGDVSISNLLGGIKTLNDLLELELPEKFHAVPLELDYEVSRKAFDLHKRQIGEALRIPPALLGTVQPGTICTFEPADGSALPVPFRLVARPQLRLGRARAEADFVAWLLPRNPANDERSMRVGKIHTVAETRPEGLLIRDNASANGTVLDGQMLDQSGTVLERRGRLVLGGAVEVEIARFDSSRPGEPPITNARNWNGPAHQAPRLRGAARCEVLATEPQPLNTAWIFTDAAFGTSRSNPIVLEWTELAEIQGRFHHYRGCFWLENLAENGVVRVDSHSLHPGEIVPLATGQHVALGSRTFRLKVET
ncbi:MAG: hypothetical protein PSU94_17505 [Lacunisphaera sp.]|nr:hypothetical protein [Lacunisphaera sp.]